MIQIKNIPVALLDSLDSTQGTKRASCDTREENMHPIQETTENVGDEDDSYGEDGVDGKSGLKTNTGLKQSLDV